MTTRDDYEDMTDPHWFTRAVFNRAADLFEEQAAAAQAARAAAAESSARRLSVVGPLGDSDLSEAGGEGAGLAPAAPTLRPQAGSVQVSDASSDNGSEGLS